MNSLKVKVQDPMKDAVIAYIWADGFKVKGPAEVFPYHVMDGVVLIGIHPNGADDICIEYGSKFK